MLLPCDKVRHVGEAIAMVVADNRYQAMNAAETINIDFEVLQFNLDGLKAANGEASPVWDELPSNTCIDATFGDVLETEKINIVIQINGKKRGLINTKLDLEELDLFKLVKKDQNIYKYISDKEIKKKIYIKNKLMNIII